MTRNKYKKQLEEILLTGTFIGFGTFILNYLTISYWQRDGLDLLEISLMTILAGVYLFVLTIIVNAVLLNKTIRNCIEKGIPTFKRIYQVMISLTIGLVVFLLIDSIFFLIDNSISKEFAQSLKEMSETNGDTLPGIEEFANLPFGIQNGVLTFVFGLIAAFISLLFVKKDGRLFSNQEEWR